jgi:pyruvate,water dikinase
MSQAQTANDLVFESPGPGSWKLDAVHFPRPVTRYWAETHPEPFRRGFSDFTRFYGMLIDTLDTAYPNGFSYTMMRPAAPEDVPSRLQRAEEVFKGKLWREQLREWDETVKPASIAAHRAIQAVDPDALDDQDLSDYLARCHEHHAAMITQHMRFTGSAMIPTGDFLAHVGAWSGLPSADLLGLLRGAAPVSAGASGELEQLVAAVAKDTRAR